jgi:hypothetical protein
MTDTKDLPELLLCPFCGNAPTVEQRPVGEPDFHQAWVHISCKRCNARPHVSGNRTATEWVGNDVPKKRYCSAEEALASSLKQAAGYWNTRSAQPSLDTVTVKIK